jgi:protein ImuA
MLSRADALCRLKTEILSLQGFKPHQASTDIDFGLDTIAYSFPNAKFPFSACHEFICESPQEIASSGAFVSGLLSMSLGKGGVALWIGRQRIIFPPALKSYGINPDQIIFINTRSEKEAIWTLEEALKSTSLTSIVGQITEFDFTKSRRFQLAIEKSGVGCFLLRYRPRNFSTASTTRWQIKPLSSSLDDNLPGVGHPRWQVNLLKVRNGKPGSWIMQWAQDHFLQPSKLSYISGELQKKAV